MTRKEVKEEALKALEKALFAMDELHDVTPPHRRRLVKHHLVMIRSIHLEVRDCIFPREVEDTSLHSLQEEEDLTFCTPTASAVTLK